MYYYIKGKLVYLSSDFAAVDCGGVAYKLIISKTTHSEIAPRIDTEVILFTYLNVREDALDLFGFFTEDEKNMFTMLIGVSGVGPKAALSILSSMTPQMLVSSLCNGDARAISCAQGIGLKTAQKIVLELKEKAAKSAFDTTVTKTAQPRASTADAINALVVLGYSRAQAQNALNDIEASTTEEMIRLALKNLAK